MIAAEKIKKRERDASLRDLWRTPKWLFVAIQRYLGITFDVDVACNKENALLPSYIGVERDALESSWGDPGTVAFLNPPYSKITPWIEAAIREQARGVTTVMLIPQSLDTMWYERATECANQTVVLSGGRVAFMEPDVTLGLVEVNINPGGSMLVVFRGFCQNAGHFMNKVPLTVMKSLGGYDPAKVIRKKRPRKQAA
ncbi:phage N-6-adenine-methyltransferase [Klebsiella pneumoniae]|uniref:phage N-6-adenine-methyltransferase n=1 Tax=Klebsiella pneumoniae TaxID=573 RepID=UPI000C19D279|nr:phage N-6-adenine-methyltransferase [Klebsiella pneumoniae]ATS16818.1 phage N-6-adenine-methyltransferase [Klebsiella pneumoniae]WLX71658.1 phage N-6-adenine-methyltransferase [Klebsiella pneumoniae]HCE0692614.1 phage N-6-adenine-methyltransferase [Klebsiella pneumoniae]